MLLPLCEGPTISCDHSGLERIGPDQPWLSKSEPMYLDLAECSILNRSVTHRVRDIIPPEWDDPSPRIIIAATE